MYLVDNLKRLGKIKNGGGGHLNITKRKKCKKQKKKKKVNYITDKNKIIQIVCFIYSDSSLISSK